MHPNFFLYYHSFSSADEGFRLCDGVEFSDIKELKLGVEMATNIHFVTDGEVEVYNGKLAFPCFHQGKK